MNTIILIIIGVWLLSGAINVAIGLGQMALGLGCGLIGIILHGLAWIADRFEKNPAG